jgi:TonB family protein
MDSRELICGQGRWNEVCAAMMKKHGQSDKERFLMSIVLAVVVHSVLFVGLHFILNIKLEAMPEYPGPIYVEIGTAFDQEYEKEEVIPEEDKSTRETATKERQDIQKEDTREREDDSSTAIVERNDAVETIPDTRETEPEEVYTENEEAEERATEQPIRETPAPASTPTPTPYDPALEEENLAELDKILEGSTSGENGTSTGEGTSDDHSTGDTTQPEEDVPAVAEGGGSVIEWEDNANRNPLAQYKPDIPGWVSQQGLRLRVKVSFLLTPDGFLTSLRIKESSGYTDVDSAILEALRKWRFPPVSGTKNVYGEITYYIGLK